MEIKVRKKNGSLEDFDRSKVLSRITKSGATSEQAETIAGQVETWTQGAAVNGVIGSKELRTKVLELLKPVNPAAAVNFETYKKAA